jgi:hypothetical protein
VRQINTVTRQDFEKAAVNVFTEEFPNSRLQGCFFHFSQAIYRHVQSAGLQASYAANPEFALMSPASIDICANTKCTGLFGNWSL